MHYKAAQSLPWLQAGAAVCGAVGCWDGDRREKPRRSWLGAGGRSGPARQGQEAGSPAWGQGHIPLTGRVPLSQSPAHQELRHHSVMYRNVILGHLAGVTCISLIFLSPSASCAAEHMPRLAAEAPGSDKQAQEHFQRISLNSFPGIFVAWEGGDRAGGDGLCSTGTAFWGGWKSCLGEGLPLPPILHPQRHRGLCSAPDTQSSIAVPWPKSPLLCQALSLPPTSLLKFGDPLCKVRA